MEALYCHVQHHNDTIIKTHAGRLLYKKYLPLTLLHGFEKGYWRFACERMSETEQKLQYFDLHSYGRQRCVFLVLLMLNRSPGVHSAWCCLSLLHLTSIFSGPQFIRAPSPFGQVWLFLPHLDSTGTRARTQLCYIIVQRPLDLWNRMFNRHQAEITVTQFTGHSLPVDQSMSVPWEYFSSSYFISQFPPTIFPLITAIRMCHLLPMHHLGMAFLAGSKGQNITEVHSRGFNDINVCRNVKNVYVGSTQEHFKNDITILEKALHTTYQTNCGKFRKM